MKIKPYLVIPKLIEQPTWGGTYIAEFKNWQNLPILKGKKIGQSYEIYSGTKLAVSITDSADKKFISEIGYADNNSIHEELFTLEKDKDYINLSELVSQNPKEILGDFVYGKFGKMPILNKFTQAQGNSFQLHVKQSQKIDKWQPKAESWYFMEDGAITFGINPQKNIEEYKAACLNIDIFMNILSNDIKTGKIRLDDAKFKARKYINELNPKQYVNFHNMPKGSVADLSEGAIHHSWEDHADPGNIVYEIQQDVMDPVSTIKSFDQGKIKSDGSVRKLSIDDYFRYLDTDAEKNDIKNCLKRVTGETIINTPYYSLDKISLVSGRKISLNKSFHHVFVEEGEITIEYQDFKLHLTRGHSAFVPFGCESYNLEPIKPSIILVSYIQ